MYILERHRKEIIMPRKTAALLFTLLLTGLFMTSCMTPQTTPEEVSPPGPALRLVCSMPHIYFFTANIAVTRKNIIIESLHPTLEKGALLWSTGDVQNAAGATTLVINGQGLEDKLVEDVKKVNPAITIIDSSKGLAPIPSKKEDLSNPYLWMSPKSGLAQAKNIAAAIIEIDSAGKKEIDRKTDEYSSALEKVIKGYEELGSAAKDKKALAGEDFLAYVSRDSGGPVTTTFESGQIGDAAKISALLKEEGALVLFMPCEGRDRNNPARGQVQYLSLCLREGTYPDSYEKTMKANLEVMTKALK
jgi:ABC-type Zn uptake system ZnuABC Zn-binding protein ZnuA